MRLPAPRRSPPRLLKEAGRQRFPEMGNHLLPRKLRDIHFRDTEQGEGGDKMAKLLPRRMYRSGIPESTGIGKNRAAAPREPGQPVCPPQRQLSARPAPPTLSTELLALGPGGRQPAVMSPQQTRRQGSAPDPPALSNCALMSPTGKRRSPRPLTCYEYSCFGLKPWWVRTGGAAGLSDLSGRRTRHSAAGGAGPTGRRGLGRKQSETEGREPCAL